MFYIDYNPTPEGVTQVAFMPLFYSWHHLKNKKFPKGEVVLCIAALIAAPMLSLWVNFSPRLLRFSNNYIRIPEVKQHIDTSLCHFLILQQKKFQLLAYLLLSIHLIQQFLLHESNCTRQYKWQKANWVLEMKQDLSFDLTNIGNCYRGVSSFLTIPIYGCCIGAFLVVISGPV